MGKGGRENFVHFAGLRHGLEPVPQYSDHRCYGERGHGFMRRQKPEDLWHLRGQADLFLSFPQSRCCNISIGFVLFATGKGDLARVMLQRG